LTLFSLLDGPALSADICKMDFEKSVVYLQKDLENQPTIKALLGKGCRVVTETAATYEMRRIKKESFQECKDDRCQIELGKAVSATHMATKASPGSIYLWDLKSEAIECTLDLPVPSPSRASGPASSGAELSPQQIIQGTLLSKGMSVEEVLTIAGQPYSKSSTSRDGSFSLTYKHSFCKGVPSLCWLYFGKDQRLERCLSTQIGICSLEMTSN
jgi:hypothetical protein